MTAHIFYRDEMSVAGSDSFSPSAGKPRAFVEMARKVFPSVTVESFDPVTREDLYLVHDRAYVDGIFAGTIRNGFGTTDPRIAQACLFTVGSLVMATIMAGQTGKRVCSPSSGFHHAGYEAGGGYCTFNGLMVAAAIYLRLHPKARVGILDLDFHYGNGTQDILLHARKLASRIIHRTSGSQFHGNEDPTSFFDWLATSVAMMNGAGCEVVILQAGADMHVDDALGGLLDDAQMAQRDRYVFKKVRGGVVWCLAGGYRTVPGETELERMRPVLETHLETLAQSMGLGRS